MKGVIIMFTDEKKKQYAQTLPVNDPKYIAFKKLKGILGHFDTDKMREDKTDEIIARYKYHS